MSEHHHHHHHDHTHTGADEANALLKYMIGHNHHHSEELEELAASFTESVQEKIHEAVRLMEEGNEKLKEALEELEK